MSQDWAFLKRAHSMLPDSHSSSKRSHRFMGALLGLCVAVFLFMLVPLTQIFQSERTTQDIVELVEVSPPPPPPPPPEEPPSPPEEPDEPPPELEMPPPLPTLEQIEVGLNPGTGGDLSLGIGFGVNLSTESVEKMEDLFGFGELDEIPRLVREGRFRYPSNSPRGRGEAFVRLLVYVETDGRISVQKVVDYSHREFVEPARRMAEGSRFSSPLRKGIAVRSRYEWPIRIPLERR